MLDTGAGSVRRELYRGGFTTYVMFACLLAASGGLLFGYDNGVTGGVTTNESFLAEFWPSVAHHKDNSTSLYCKYSDPTLELFTSSLFLAGACTALVGSWTTTRFGRKASMFIGAVCFLIGAVLCASAQHIAMLILGRIFLGAGVGFANQSVPLFLSEMAPFHMRGALNIMFQLATTIGILAAQLINFGTQYAEPWGWRMSLGLAAVPAAILVIGSIVLPDTPNSLIARSREDEGRAVLERVRGTTDVDAEFLDICDAAKAAAAVPNPWRTILERRYRPQLIISILIPFFQQLTGINAIIFYAPQLFSSLGSGASMALINTVIIGAVNIASTFVAILCADRFGRRSLFLEGGVQMLIAHVVVGVVLGEEFSKYGNTLPTNVTIAVIVLICLFIAGFAWSWGPLGWLVPSEIQPLETRSAGQSITVVVNFLMSFLIAQLFLTMLCHMEEGVFFFFAGWVAVMTAFVYFLLPETRGMPVEEIASVFRSHWFWSKVLKDTADSAEPQIDEFKSEIKSGAAGVSLAANPKVLELRKRSELAQASNSSLRSELAQKSELAKKSEIAKRSELAKQQYQQQQPDL